MNSFAPAAGARRRPHLSPAEFGHRAIESPGEHRQAAGRHLREEVVLDMQEHVVGDEIPERVVLGARGVVDLLGIVVHGPDGEERGQALGDAMT